MRSILVAAVLIQFSGLALAQVKDGPKYNFVFADFSKGEVCVVNKQGKITRTYKAKDPNDVWGLPDGSVMFAHRGGVRQYDRNGKLVFEWKSNEKKDEIHTCQPLPDGNVLIAQNGRSRLIEVDRSGKITKEISVPSKNDNLHMRYRMCRKLKNGHYLCMVSCDNEIRELDKDGKVVRVITELPGIKMEKPHAVMRLANGNTLFSTGAGVSAVEVDPKNKVVWKLTPKDVPEIKMGFMTGLSRLPNGNTVICFYQGSHHIIEVTPRKELVWKWRLPSQKTLVSAHILNQSIDGKKGELLK